MERKNFGFEMLPQMILEIFYDRNCCISLYRTIFGDDWEICRWSMTRQKSRIVKHEILPRKGGEERVQNKNNACEKTS
jgi:hypothetical protein